MSTRKLTAVLAFCAMALTHGGAWSQQPPVQPTPAEPSAATAPETRGKEPAKRPPRPTAGKAVVSLVFDENGQVIEVLHDGQPLPPCQVCTPDLERRYGTNCAKARKLSDLKAAVHEAKGSGTPLICDKLTNTTVKEVNPVTVIKHTGSECITFFVNVNGQAVMYQYCW